MRITAMFRLLSASLKRSLETSLFSSRFTELSFKKLASRGSSSIPCFANVEERLLLTPPSAWSVGFRMRYSVMGSSILVTGLGKAV
jgi:hypothetical protein